MSEDWVRHFDSTTQYWYRYNTQTGESRYSDSDNEEKQEKDTTSELTASQTLDEYRGVHVIRTLGNDPVFKHWALYIEDKDKDGPHTGFICNIEGESENYRYVCQKVENPKNAENYVDEYQVGYVDTDFLEKLKEFAEAKRIKNEDKFWGCQEWVWEILSELEKEGLLEHRDEFEERIAELEKVKGPG